MTFPTETTIQAWFAVHAFTRTVLFSAFIGATAYAKKDWNKFREAQAKDSAVTFHFPTAIREWLWGMVLAVSVTVVPLLWAEVFKLLGGGVLPTP